MAIRIETDNRGDAVIWGEKGGKAAPLMVKSIFMQMSTGHIFVAPSGAIPLMRLNPHETGMVEYWLRERGSEIGPNIFDGEPPVE